MIEEARMKLGFKQLGSAEARVRYEQEGRSGTVIFQRNETVLRFWNRRRRCPRARFCPDDETWETQTGLPIADRMPILDFVGRQILAKPRRAILQIGGQHDGHRERLTIHFFMASKTSSFRRRATSTRAPFFICRKPSES